MRGFTLAVFLSTGDFKKFLIWKVCENETSLKMLPCLNTLDSTTSGELISRSASVFSSRMKSTKKASL